LPCCPVLICFVSLAFIVTTFYGKINDDDDDDLPLCMTAIRD